jgi:hypothetical protein
MRGQGPDYHGGGGVSPRYSSLAVAEEAPCDVEGQGSGSDASDDDAPSRRREKRKSAVGSAVAVLVCFVVCSTAIAIIAVILRSGDASSGSQAAPAEGLLGAAAPPPPLATSLPTNPPKGSVDEATDGPQGGCEANEELFLGMCYMNCSVATGVETATRMAPSVCCKEWPCVLPNQFDFNGAVPCTGYFVDGERNCPHPPGKCLENEEWLYGKCYMKCSILTNGTHPHRVATNTCCSENPCWNPFNDKTSGAACSGFAVGGGVDQKSKCPHLP